MTDLSQNGLSHDEVVCMLESRDGIRRDTYKLYLTLDGIADTENPLPFISAAIECNSDEAVKYAGSFSFEHNSRIDWNAYRLQLHMEWNQKGKIFRWPLSPPMAVITEVENPRPDSKLGGPRVNYGVEAYDETIFLQDNRIEKNYYYSSGTAYTYIAEYFMKWSGFERFNITPSGKSLPAAIEIEQGTIRLTAINSMLESIAYKTLEQHKSGVLISSPYESIYTIDPGINYRDGYHSLIIAGQDEIERTKDSFNKPNLFIGYVDNSDLPSPMRYEFLNESATDPFSSVNRGYIIPDDPQRFDDVADLETLQRKVLQRFEEVTLSYETTSIPIAVMPHHEVNEIVGVENTLLGISDIFIEKFWRITVNVDNYGAEEAYMSHRLRSRYNVN